MLQDKSKITVTFSFKKNASLFLFNRKSFFAIEFWNENVS